MAKKRKFKPSQAGARAMVAARKKNVKKKSVNPRGMARRKAVLKKVGRGR